MDILTLGVQNTAAVLPAIIGAIIILLIGWIIGRLLGRAVRIVIDKATAASVIGESEIGQSVKKTGISLGYLGDICVRLIIYLIAILAAVDILNLEYLSQFMTTVVEYIPHVVAFGIILVAGILLTDFFIDFFQTYSKNTKIELMSPVLLLLRIFLYFVIIILALSQLLLDLTIIYTIIVPIAWGIGIGIGAAIAIFAWFWLKNHNEEVMNALMEGIAKK